VAGNPGPLTLNGTNTWVVGTSGAWVIDPGPDLLEHLEAVASEADRRGGLAGIVLTHGHGDHSDGVATLLAVAGAADVFAAASGPEALPGNCPLERFALPGHTADHVGFHFGKVAFTGDALFAESSVFVSPGPGSLAGYLESLELLAGRGPELIAPGHGPVIDDPVRRIGEQVAHRRERERRLLEALAAGSRTPGEILAVVWDDVPELLLPAASVTLAAHLQKLDEEGLLPEGVEMPDIPDWVV
jgi:glyoxylase-like metal-dependent hydrolase (beta-lactamase superfamily II)